MELKTSSVRGVAVVRVSGKILMGNGDTALRKHVFDLLDGEQPNILLDLHDVSSIDSAGLGELGAAYKRAKDRKGEIKLLTPSKKVDHLLKLFRLDEVFDTFEDEQVAIDSFRSRSDC